MKQKAILLAVVVCIVLAGSAMGMSSTNYRLDWFTPLTSGGGGAASSTNYAINLTIGQAAIGGLSSDSYAAGIGYWYGVATQYKIYLPVVLRN